MTRRKVFILLGFTLGFILFGITIWVFTCSRQTTGFNAQRAYQDVQTQVAFGPRIPGSQAHAEEISFISSELETAGWLVTHQKTSWEGFPVTNIIAERRKESSSNLIILGAHYDSRMFADRDTGRAESVAVPGANDGASGVAVLLELARTLPRETVPVWLVFFDAEDNGGLKDRDWCMGSRAFVASLTVSPMAVIIVDMVGDSDLNLYKEANSSPALVDDIWELAEALGYKQFISEVKFSLLDDHTPFLEAGIPAAVIIDFIYPFWHTLADTPDKVSPESLQAVGQTLLSWIVQIEEK